MGEFYKIAGQSQEQFSDITKFWVEGWNIMLILNIEKNRQECRLGKLQSLNLAFA